VQYRGMWCPGTPLATAPAPAPETAPVPLPLPLPTPAPAPDCSTCSDGCFVEGQCYHQTPTGEAATEVLCVQYRGMWCPGTPPATAPPPAPVTAPVPVPLPAPTPVPTPVSNCGTCSGGCIVHGQCHHRDPTGATATEPVCAQYRGTWCPGTPPATAPAPVPAPVSLSPVTPCSSQQDLMSDALLYVVCNFNSPPDPQIMAAASCSSHQGTVICDHDSACEALGGQATRITCSDSLSTCDEVCQSLRRANTTGSCDGIWTSYGPELKDVVDWAARKCCRNYPATACEPWRASVHFCKNASDFLPSDTAHSWCEFRAGFPAHAECVAAGCHPHMEEGREACHCQEEAACTHLNGTMESLTCTEEADHWSREPSIYRAMEQGSCANLFTSWGEPLEQAVRHLARNCCASFPASICDPGAVLMTPCKETGDFIPDGIASEWCEMHGRHVSEAKCQQAGCRPEYGHDHMHCACNGPTTCSAAGGHWRHETCQDEIMHWDEGGRSLRQAAPGACEAIHTSWGEELEQALRHRARNCCRSYPATFCNPTAEPLTPCADTDDMMSDVVLHQHCDFGRPMLNRTACLAARCRFHDHDAHSSCDCPTQASCEQAGGTFRSRTCGAEFREMWDRGLSRAIEQRDCTGVTMDWGEDVSQWVVHAAERCCSSFPASICNPNATVMHPCASEAAFNASAVMDQWCDYYGHDPDRQDCERAGFCDCHKRDACEHFGGIYHERVCGAAMVHWDQGGQGLRRAHDMGTCEGVTTDWGESLTQALHHPASRCCTDFPKTACQTDAEA